MIFHIFLLTLLGYTQTTWCAAEGGGSGGDDRVTSPTPSESRSPQIRGALEHSLTPPYEFIHTEETDFVYLPIKEKWSNLATQVARIFEARNHWDASRQKFLPARFDGNNPAQLLTDLTGAITTATSKQKAAIFSTLENFITEGIRKGIFTKITPTTSSSLQALLDVEEKAALDELTKAQTRLASIKAFKNAIPKTDE